MVEEGIAAGEAKDVNSALQDEKLLKTTFIHDSLAHEIRQAAKALDKCQPPLCVLASNCNEPICGKLVEALCAEYQITLLRSMTTTIKNKHKKVGEWISLCKTDGEGKPHKVAGCSYVVVKDYGKESQAKNVIKEDFKCKKCRNKL
ncbi:40S ribosomal protein S12-like [Dipodomys spectabilis]|uniref:40S ribosomal protein S12-like n=1 Tax=Dipodomys spectabilis TaxID=105255 RepID=UPI001C54AE2D|nr:40S ribosomal protein S12-like [Dipodomys spectabilis]